MTYTFIFSFPCIVEEIMTLRYKYILRLAISGIWIYCYVLCERRLQFMYTNIWSVTVRNWMGDGVFHSYIDVRCYHLNINAAVYNPVTHSNVTNWIIGGSELDMPLRICIMSNARWWMHFFFSDGQYWIACNVALFLLLKILHRWMDLVLEYSV